MKSPRTVGEMATVTLALLAFAALLVCGLIGLAEMARPQMEPERVSAKDLCAEARYRANR